MEFIPHPFPGFFTPFSCKLCDGCKSQSPPLGFPGWGLQHLQEPAVWGGLRVASRVILTANNGNFPPFSDFFLAIGCIGVQGCIARCKGCEGADVAAIFPPPRRLHRFIIIFFFNACFSETPGCKEQVLPQNTSQKKKKKREEMHLGGWKPPPLRFLGCLDRCLQNGEK